MSEQERRVVITYEGGVNRELDDRIESIAGRWADGSGCFMIEPYDRDLEFVCQNLADAEDLKSRLEVIDGITIEIPEEEDEDQS